MPASANRHPDGRDPIDPRTLHANVSAWYNAMAPCWRSVEPPVRHRLLMTTHVWIAMSVFPDNGMPVGSVEDLGPGGTLATGLNDAVPVAEAAVWRPWVRTVLHDLRRALRRPTAERTEAWCRSLFMIPYQAGVEGTGSTRRERPA